jgi:hypothetical protein
MGPAHTDEVSFSRNPLRLSLLCKNFHLWKNINAEIEESLETFYESQIHVHVYLCMVFVDVSYNIKYYIAHLEITLRVNYFSNLFWRYLFCEGLRCWFT